MPRTTVFALAPADWSRSLRRAALVAALATTLVVPAARAQTPAGEFTPALLYFPSVQVLNGASSDAVLELRHKSGKLRFRYTLAAGGEILASGVAVIHTSVFPGRRIWRGSAQFVSYCLEESRPLHSNARGLYCSQPPTIFRYADVKPD